VVALVLVPYPGRCGATAGSAPHPVYFALPLLLVAGILARAPLQLMTPATYRQFAAQEQAFQADAAFLSGRPGAALCENTLLCYTAGKPFVYNSFLVNQMVVTGMLPENKVLALLEAGAFSVIQVEQPLDLVYFDKLAYIAVISSDRFTENFKRALGKHYRLTHKTLTGAFYEPILPALPP
jgi:hypothetical protein